MRAAVVIALVACGGGKAPPAQPAITRQVTVEKPAPPKSLTCGDVGVILRGHVEDERAAGPAKEAAIARACLHDQWSADVIRCVGSERRPKDCLDKLATAQRKSYEKWLVAWNDEYPDELFEDYAIVDDDPAPTCADGIGEPADYLPAVTLTGEDKTFAVALREAAIRELCTSTSWDVDVLQCLKDDDVETCRAMLGVDQQQALADRLAEIDKLGAKTSAQRKKPAAIDCKQVAAAHYSDAAWRAKAADVKAAERAKLAARSRAKLRKACTDDAWSASLRACVVAGGAGGSDPCFTAGGQSPATWGFYAGTMVPSGIPECDAYGAAILALSRCTAMPPAASQQLMQAYSQSVTAWARIPADQKQTAATACKLGEEAIRQSASTVGCPI